LFGLLSGFGFLALCGVQGCSLIFVIPYLIIGIGIDDMFIIYSSFVHAHRHRTIRSSSDASSSDNDTKWLSEIISKTLLKSGVSITITSLTDFVAFIVGITTGFKSVQIFCVYAAFSILFCYFNQLTLFSGVLCLHARRIEKKKNSFLLFIDQADLSCSVKSSKDTPPEWGESKELENLNASNVIDPEANKEGITLNKGSLSMRTLIKRFFKFLICTKVGKMVSVLVYVVYISISIYLALQIREGINLGDLVSEDSYFNHYITETQRLTDLHPVVMIYIHEPIDYDSTLVRLKLNNFIKNAQKIDGISSEFNINWLNAFSHNKLNYKKSPEFLIQSLKSFPPYVNDVIIGRVETDLNTNETKRTLFLDHSQIKKEKRSKSNHSRVEYEISASRFYLQYNSICFCSKDAHQMHLLRKLCSESGLPITAYSTAFKVFEQFEQTMPNVIQSFIIAVEAMYLIALIFMPDLISVFCIIFSMMSIMTGLIGAMHAWGLSLSSITMLELIMSIGFCVDFSAHVTHAFIACVGKGTRNERAYKACIRMGFPIFNSALSTMIGCSLLAFCKSFIFISFFKTIVILMGLGIFNSLLFLPVLLSIVGPNWPRHKETVEKTVKSFTEIVPIELTENLETIKK
jgi:predicted RND superfamily exporter protein